MFIRWLLLMALGLWTGAVLFFSFFVALPVLDRMKVVAEDPTHWLHVKDGSSVGLKEAKDGTRVAGEMLDVVFSRYFLFQIGCGVVAFFCSFKWIAHKSISSKVRIVLAATALSLAVTNQFILAKRVHDLRNDRYSANIEKAQAAEKAFQGAHSASLIVDMVGLLCVIGCLSTLATWKPTDERIQPV